MTLSISYMSSRHMLSRWLMISVCLLPWAMSASAELLPEEVAVVAARGSRESQELAEYYLKQRGIPTDHICQVDMPRGEVCPRDQWTWAVRPEIRKWLDEHDPNHKLKCLVTLWDVPLKISPNSSDKEQAKYRQFLDGE